MAIVYVEKEKVAHVRTLNTTTAKILKGQFVIWGAMFGVADYDSEVGDPLSLHIEPNIEIQVAAADLAEQTAKAGDNLYVNSAGKFTKAAGTDNSNTMVGVVSLNDIAGGGTLKFIKF
jgi:predicted RecA/RadA family phage recombinase